MPGAGNERLLRPGSKLTLPVNEPAAKTLPLPSTATAVPVAEAFWPPICRDQRKFPGSPGADETIGGAGRGQDSAAKTVGALEDAGYVDPIAGVHRDAVACGADRAFAGGRRAADWADPEEIAVAIRLLTKALEKFGPPPTAVSVMLLGLVRKPTPKVVVPWKEPVT